MMINLNSDLEVLAATIWGEARGEINLGKEAAASVVLNRAAIAAKIHRPQFGNGTIRSACLAPYQFSCWNSNDPNLLQIKALDFTKPDVALIACIAVARNAIDGKLHDPTNGCTYYKTTVTPWPASWGPYTEPTVIIGHQGFYKLP